MREGSRLLQTSDSADEMQSVVLGGRRIIHTSDAGGAMESGHIVSYSSLYIPDDLQSNTSLSL